MDNVRFGVWVVLNPSSIPILVQVISPLEGRQTVLSLMGGVMTRIYGYELLREIEELAGAQERNYLFHGHFCFMGDSFVSMSVGTDGRWVNQLVRDDVPRFQFNDDSELMGEDRNDVLDF